MRITSSIKGTNNIEKWLTDKAKGSSADRSFLEACGRKGVSALANNTPKRSGTVANSWAYHLSRTSKGWDLQWYNSAYPGLNVNVAVLIQYGHGTRNGGYVPGVDYINPAMKPIMESISNYFMKGD